jgi:hypothetical protein
MPQFEQGSSKVVSILYRLILTMVEDFKTLPPHLHINLDNCWRLVRFKKKSCNKSYFRENKNMFLFSFLCALVELDVFIDVTVNFMLVGQEFLNLVEILTIEYFTFNLI